MADKKEAENTISLLERLEAEYGVVTCEKNNVEGCYQWDYPNGWAPMQYIVVKGLLNYGYKKEALRIAKKFVSLIEKCYSTTHNLWEKYNVVTGDMQVSAEYKTPTMLGWTYGIYEYCCEIIKEINLD